MTGTETVTERQEDAKPKRCGDCEYFDGEGRREGDFIGDCHNRLAPRFQAGSNDCCKFFYPSTT